MPPTHPSRNWTGCGSTHTKSIIEFWWHQFLEIARLHASHASYTLSSEAHRILNRLNEEFIADVNEAITEGRIPPKTKKIDIILRVAASLHIFNHVTTQLLQQTQPTMPSEEIEKSTLLRAIEYVGWAESQKEIFVEVS